MPTIEEIKAAIKAQKWGKSTYVYALDHMEYQRCWSAIESLYKKAEIIERFYKACEDPTKFARIARFTTFKHLA